MKKIIPLILAVLTASSSFVSCTAETEKIAPDISVSSSDAAYYAKWLDDRLGDVPDKVILGTGDSSKYGIDMTGFENDGYIIREMGDEILLFGKTETGLDKAVRKYAKYVESGTEASPSEVYHDGYRIKDFRIAGNPISQYSIIADGVTEALGMYDGFAYSVPEFVRLIRGACGVTIPYGEGNTDTPHHIYMKYTDDESLGELGYIYKIENGDLYFYATTDLGMNDANCMFLQEECGWLDLMQGDSDLQCADLVDVPEGLNVRNVPMCDYFWAYDPSGSYINERAYVSHGYVTNACHGQQTYRWGGFDASWGNPCYSAEGAEENIYADIYEYVRARVDAGQIIGKDLLYVDMAQGDHLNFCHCSKCMKVMKEENGANAGPIVRAANAISEMLDEDYPNIKLLNFAYHGSNIPPKTAPCDNVYFTFCTDGHCTKHYFDGSQCQWESFDMAGALGQNCSLNNNDYAEWIKDWCELSDNMYVWFYALDNNFHQYSIIDTLYEDFQYLNSCGIKGMFWQIPCHGLGLVKIEQQLGTLLNWDTDMTKAEYNAHLERLLEKTYGDGYDEVLKYIDLQHEAEHAIQNCVNCWNYASVNFTADENVDFDTYRRNWDKMVSLLDSAMSKATSAKQQSACELLEVSMLYIGCYINYFPAYDAGDVQMLEKLNERYNKMIDYITKNGYNYEQFYGVDGLVVSIHGTLEETAWLDWVEFRAESAPDTSVWIKPPVTE